MRRFPLLFLSLVSVVVSFATPPDMRELFSTLEIPVLKMTVPSARLDLLDYYDSGMQGQVRDALIERVVIDMLTSDQVKVTLADTISLKLTLLPYGKQSVVMQILELPTPAIDAEIKFYDLDSNELPADRFIPRLYLDDWQSGKLNASDRAKLEDNLPFIMYSADYDPATQILTLDGSFVEYLPVESYQICEPLLRPQLRFKWNGKKFQPVKQ